MKNDTFLFQVQRCLHLINWGWTYVHTHRGVFSHLPQRELKGHPAQFCPCKITLSSGSTCSTHCHLIQSVSSSTRANPIRRNSIKKRQRSALHISLHISLCQLSPLHCCGDERMCGCQCVCKGMEAALAVRQFGPVPV